MTEQTKGFTELVKNLVADAVALLTHYSFDLRSRTAVELVDKWLTDYSPAWIHLAVVEALYQGRYKAVSVEQILALWQRRGQPLHHFNHEFERLVCNNLPRSLTAIRGADPESDAQNAAIADLLRNLHRDITQPTEDSDVASTAASKVERADNAPVESVAVPMPAEILPANPTPTRQEATPLAHVPILPVLPASAATVVTNADSLSLESASEASPVSGTIVPLAPLSSEVETSDETVKDAATAEADTAPSPVSEISTEGLPSTPPQPNSIPQTSNYPGLAELVESARQEILDNKPVNSSLDTNEVAQPNPIDAPPLHPSTHSLPPQLAKSTSQNTTHRPVQPEFGLQSAIDANDLLKPVANHDPINQFTPVPESSEFYTKLRAVAHVDEQGLAG